MKTNKLIPILTLTALCALPAARGLDQVEVEADILKDNDVIIERQARSYADAAADVKREVERNLKDVERQVRVAQVHAGQIGPAFKRAFGASYVNSAEPPVIVASSPLEPAAVAELREDLTVMSKLVNDAVADDRDDPSMRRAMGIVVNWLPGNAATDDLYIEDHGVIVQTTVRFPLAPAKKEETTKPAEAPKNSAWESARRELFGGENEEADVVFPPERREEYDAGRVEALKNNVLKALTHASNFRRLGGDETATVVVRSRVGSRSQIVVFKSQDGHGKTQASTNESDSTMTIRIKKSDADALAAGKITEDEFRQRAKLAIY